jgi:hypothetical protein
MLVRQKQADQAVEYLTGAINLALIEALETAPSVLANMFLTRMRAYE